MAEFPLTAPNPAASAAGGDPLLFRDIVDGTPTPTDMARRKTRHPVLDLVTESDLDGTCHGWDGTTVFRLSNGEVWRQSAVRHRKLRLCRPALRIWRMGARFWLEFEGVAEILPVERVPEPR